jgi:hypothetical protein
MKFVATKTADQLDLQALHRVRARRVSQHTGIINQIAPSCWSAGVRRAKGCGYGSRSNKRTKKLTATAEVVAGSRGGAGRPSNGRSCPFVPTSKDRGRRTSRRRSSTFDLYERRAIDPRAATAAADRAITLHS